MGDFFATADAFTKEHESHESHLEVMAEARDEIYEECKKLPIGDSEILRYVALKSQCEYFLFSISEITKSLMLSLENNCYSSAEALARISVEYSINLIYVVEGEGHDRAKSLLKNYLLESKRKTDKWKSYVASEGNEKSVEMANSKLDYLDALQSLHPELVDKNIKGWPDARTRFEKVGLESLYHTIFASASDSVHSLSEDAFNIMIVESGPEEAKKAAADAVFAEKRSFAFYLASWAILCFAEAAARLASEMGESQTGERIEQVTSKVGKLIEEHEALSEKYHGLVTNN